MALGQSFCGSLALVLFASASGWAEISAKRYLDEVKYLSSDELKGRGTGTPGLEKAARHLAREFRDIGLKPVGGKDYFQSFHVTTNARLGTKNRADVVENGRRRVLKPEQDFRPFNFSATGPASAGVVFAGYGITAREYGYDDYAGLDVKGKFVIVLRHEPQENDNNSVFLGRNLTEHAQFASKASNAKAHGAAGVILVNDTGNHGGSDELEPFVRTVGPHNAGIPFVQVKAAAADQWLASAGKSVKELEDAIDKDLKPRSFALPEGLHIELSIDLRRDVRTVENVAGYLEGAADEYVVIGAHYDHLGMGEQFSMAPSQSGKIHPGADDNASGAAGVVELGRHLAAGPKQKRGVLFLCFAGEELGLLGSSFYVNNSKMPIERAVAMLNLDMIGRIREGKVYVGGAGTGTTLKAILEEAVRKSELKVDFTDQAGYGSSDHTSFTTKQVPVLFFFSGLHGDYHRPSDTWDKIEPGEAAKLLRMVADITARLANGDERPQYVRSVPAVLSGKQN